MGFYCVFITAIVFFGISIIGQSFGELLVLRQDQKLTCLSEDDDSAFIWNTVYATRETLDFQPAKPTQKTDPPCAIWNSTECRAHWENMTGWERVGSQFKPMAPVLDFRWEDFKEFTGKGHIDHSEYQNVGTVNGSSGSVAFTARGQSNLQILLCENENPTTGPCFWIILGGWEGTKSVMRFCGSGGPPGGQAPRPGNCIEKDNKTHRNGDILDPYEWRTFRLIWSSDERKMQIIRYTDHDKEPFLQQDVKGEWPNVSHMSIRLDTTSRVRFHFYEYLLTEKKDSVLYSEEFHHYEEHFCFKLLLGLCAECKLSVKLVDNSSRGFEIENISGEQSSAYNGTLIWRSVELSKNLTDYDLEFKRPFRLEIRTILTKDKATGQWAIDNFRMCKPGGQRRESTISFPQNPTKVGCQKLSYNERTVIRLMSASKINANTNESQQFIDELVKDCGSSCKNFSKNSLLCNARGCTCNRGFKGTDCSETCTDGYYGYNCGRKCETCIFGFCNKITGLCATSCRNNTLLPPLCETERPTVADITDTTAVIVQKIELETNSNARVEVTIQVKFPSDLWMNFTAKREGSGIPLSYKSDISNLTQDTVYTYRTIVSVILAEGTIPVTSPEMNFTTTCFMQPNFTVTPGKTSLKVDLENQKLCTYDNGPRYSVHIYEPVKNITKHNHTSAKFQAVYDKLTPDTEYNVKIFNTRINKTVFDRKYRTLEAAPSEVENLTAPLITENKTTLWWNPPLHRNGLIRYYNVSLTGKLIACEEGENGKLHDVPWKKVNETILTIPGLHPYAVYTATVVAHTIEPGMPKTVEFQTLETEIPQSKFSNLTLVNKKTLHWGKPADCTTVTGPTRTAKLSIENIDNSTETHEDEQTTEPYIHLIRFGELTPFARYTVRLYVMRNDSRPINSTYYQELTWRTSPSEPPPVKKLEIHDADIETNTISLRWIPPHPANGEIESYKVSIKQRGKFISNKTFEVLEERLKCEFETDYVCLKNFTIHKDIKENKIYKIEVRAINKEVSNPGAPNGLDITLEIYKKKPSDPKNFTSILQKSGIVKLNWARDRFTSTKINEFYIKVNQTSTKLLSDKIHEVSMKHSAGINQTEYSVELHLMTSTDYKVSIVAVNWFNFTSNESEIHISVPGSIAYERGANVTIKQIGNFIEVLAPEVVNATKNTSVSVTVYGLMTCRTVNSPKSSPPTKQKEWLAAVYKLEENKPKNLTIGHIHNHGDRFNCTFDMGKTYYVVLTATDLYSGTTAALESAPTTLQVPVPPPKSNLTWLIIFPIFAISVLIFFAYRKLKQLQKEKDARSSTDHSIALWDQYKPTTPSLDARSDRPSIQQTAPDVVPYNPFSYPVEIDKFEDYTKEELASGLLKSQYEKFTRGLTKPCDYGRLPENKAKNRYTDLIAYDETRVVLKKISGDPHSDYINASYIPGYLKERAYIATQGPKPNTVNDFWRMVWQENVRVICMLANVIEGGKRKCEQYWPDVGNKVTHGDILVSNIDHQVFVDYTFRTFTLIHQKQTRKITHLHYTGWPDHGVPMYTQSLVPYLKKLLETETGDGPVVVHCSAGVGRTGTIILCDTCLRSVREEGVVDLPAVTLRMRKRRANMVDNAQQYLLAHLVIVECMVSEQTQIPCNGDLQKRIKEIRKRLPHDVRRLNDTVWQDRALHSLAAPKRPYTLALTNDGISELVPVYPHAADSDPAPAFDIHNKYITAVGVDGVKLKNQYLASRLPSPANRSDLWRLIAQENVELIIILQRPDPEDPTYCDIIPDELNLIRVTQVEVGVEIILEEEDNFTIDKYVLVRKDGEPQPVTVLTCSGWENGTQGKPPSADSLVSLWRASEKISRQEGPTFVLCRDGITGCGLYLALSFLLERMAVARECDVISAVRAVRRFKPEFVQTMEQFEYLYDAAVNYDNCFQTYANFS